MSHLDGGVDVEAARQLGRLVADDTHLRAQHLSANLPTDMPGRLPSECLQQEGTKGGQGGYRSAVHARESNDDILGVVRHDLEEVSLVDDLMDDLVHVVRDVGVGRDDDVQSIARAVGRVGGLSPWGVVLSRSRISPVSVLAKPGGCQR